MILKAFSLFDSKADVFMPPFFCGTVGQATRSVIEAAADQRSTLGKYPQDFALFELGEFEDATGELVAFNKLNHGLVSQLLVAAIRAHRAANPELPLEPAGTQSAA